MEYTIYIESNRAGELAYAMPNYNSEICDLVETGFGEYEFKKGLEIVKQNGNIVTAYPLESREQTQELVKLLLDNGLPKAQISSFLTFA